MERKVFKKLIGLQLGLFIALASFAQQGTITLNDGSVQTGIINVSEWENNPSIISFKKDDSSEPEEYTSEDVSMITVLKDLYKTSIVESDSDKRSVFLKQVIGGEKSLYFVRFSGNEIFFIERNSGFEKLVQENETYITQLEKYLSQCDKIESISGALAYNQTSLKNLFIEYFDCVESQDDFGSDQSLKNKRFILGFLAGFSSSSIEFSGRVPSLDYLIESDYPNSTSITGGIFAEWFFLNRDKNFSLYNELNYISFETQGTYETTLELHETEIAFSYIRLNTSIKYDIPFGNMGVFIHLGLSNAFVVSSTNTRFFENSLGATANLEALPNQNDYQFGYVAGLGVRFQRFLLEGRYDFGYEPANVAVDTNLKFYSVLLGYRLGD